MYYMKGILIFLAITFAAFAIFALYCFMWFKLLDYVRNTTNSKNSGKRALFFLSLVLGSLTGMNSSVINAELCFVFFAGMMLMFVLPLGMCVCSFFFGENGAYEDKLR